MTIDKLVSFAQMAEDVVLWRALKHRDAGFFVDVGAHHPVGSSVTKIFSNAGWRGINIDPIQSLIDLFAVDRPNDINLAVGISNEPGFLKFFDVENDQQRSTFDQTLGNHYKANGFPVIERSIPVISLNEVFERHVNGPVDFLKVDAEGHEASVLLSLDFKRWRPHVVIVEAPLNQPRGWLCILENAGYTQALFDGLNRFYVAAEHRAELGELLSYPACSNDHFVSYDHLLEVNELKREIARLNGVLEGVTAK